MRPDRLFALLALSSAIAVAACGSDDPASPPAASAGSAGKAAAGTSGAAGGAGVAGAAGAAGLGGSSGTGGSAGSSAGAAGAAGMAGGPCEDKSPIPPSDTPPPLLSMTGLFSDIKTLALSPEVQLFQPKYALWTDAAEKKRWVYVPKCKKIDTTDPDHWVFPQGTRWWKQFDNYGKRLETRLIHKYGPTADDYYFVAYQWRDDLSDADLVDPMGVQNAKGTVHDIPSEAQCRTCHGFLPEHSLGFSAVQLSHDSPGLTLKQLVEAGRVTSPPPPAGYQVPGDPVAQAAVGYLHANCGHCHNSGNSAVTLRMRVLTGQQKPTDLDVVTTAVGKAPTNFVAPGVVALIDPGKPDSSAVVYRMSQRNSTSMPNVQMPPIGTEKVDDPGVAAVRAWVQTLK